MSAVWVLRNAQGEAVGASADGDGGKDHGRDSSYRNRTQCVENSAALNTVGLRARIAIQSTINNYEPLPEGYTLQLEPLAAAPGGSGSEVKRWHYWHDRNCMPELGGMAQFTNGKGRDDAYAPHGEYVSASDYDALRALRPAVGVEVTPYDRTRACVVALRETLDRTQGEVPLRNAMVGFNIDATFYSDWKAQRDDLLLLLDALEADTAALGGPT